MNEANVMVKNNIKNGRDVNGRFVKGHRFSAGPHNIIVYDLIEALENKAKRRKYPNFLSYVADRAWINDQVLMAVLKKILPDRVATEGEVLKVFNLIYAYRNSNPNSPKSMEINHDRI